MEDPRREYVPLVGWLASGPQRQGSRGWFVHVEKPDEGAMPVAVVSCAGWWRRLLVRALLGR